MDIRMRRIFPNMDGNLYFRRSQPFRYTIPRTKKTTVLKRKRASLMGIP